MLNYLRERVEAYLKSRVAGEERCEEAVLCVGCSPVDHLVC